MKITRILAGMILLAACSSDLPHEAPFDDKAPLSKQAKGQIVGRITLENESDHSQVAVQLQNADRTYSVQTEADGSVSLTGVVPGEYTLKIGTRYFEHVTEAVTVKLGEQLDLGARSLAARRTGVFGKAVIEDKEGNQAGGVTVTLARIGSLRTAAAAPAFENSAASSAAAISHTVQSAADGTYRVGGVASGIYTAVASKPGVGVFSIPKVTVTGEDGEVEISDAVILPMFGSLEILGKVNGAVTSPTVTLRFTATGNPASIEMAFDPGFVSALPVMAFTQTATLDLPAGDGLKAVYVRYFDIDGNASSTGGDTVILDTTPPQPVSFSIVEASPAKTNPVTLAYSAPGATELRVTEGATCGGPREPVGSGTKAFTLSSSEGLKSVAMQFFDRAGNASECVLRNVYFDPNPPVVGVFTFGAAATSSNVVTVTFQGVSGASKVIVSEDAGFAGADWTAFAPAKTFVLSFGNGVKTVYAKVADDAGWVVSLPQQTITLDTTPPSSPSIFAAYDVTTQTSVLLTLSAGLVSDMWVSVGDPTFASGGWETYTGSKVISLSGADGTKTIYAKFKKSTGLETGVVSDTVVLDRAAPILPNVLVNGGVAVVTSEIVTLNLSAVDTASGLGTYKVNTANDFSAVSPKPFQPTDVFSFATGDGPKTVWVTIGDRAGLYSTPVSATVLLDTTAPAVGGAVTLTKIDGTVLTLDDTLGESRVVLTSSVSDASALQMQVTTNGSYTGVAWVPYEPNKVIELAGGAASISARVRDGAGLITDLVTAFTLTVDTTAPALTFNRISASPSKDLTVSLALSASETSDAQVSDNSAFDGAAWFPAANTSVILAAGDGTRTLYARARDAAGNVSAVKTVTVQIDQTPPQLAGFAINGGALHTKNAAVPLTFTGIEIVQYRAAEDTCSGAYATHAGSATFNLAGGEGLRTVAVQFQDAVGNETACLVKTITLDTLAPAVASFSINADAAYATSRVVTLNIGATDADEMQVSESSSFAGAGWLPVTSATSLVLSVGEGARTVYARFRDLAGNTTQLSDTISVDTVAPAFNAVTGPVVTNSRTLPLFVTATGADEMQVSSRADFAGAAWTPYAASTTYYLAATEGTQTVYVRLRDAALNPSVTLSHAATLDQSGPATPIVTVAGGAYTNAETITLQIAGDAAAVMLSEDAGFSGASWQAYAAVKSFTLSAGDGLKTVYVKVRDAAGNESGSDSVTVTLDKTFPVVTLADVRTTGGVSIADGAATNQSRVVVVSTVSDGNALEMQVSTAGSYTGAVWEPYSANRILDLALPTAVDGESRGILARVRDAAGNVSDVFVSRGLVLDTIAPSAPSLVINGKIAGAVSAATVSVTLSAAGNPVDAELAYDPGFVTSLGSFAPTGTHDVPLTAVDGSKNLYARFFDAAGNVSALAGDLVVLDSTPPQVASVSIAQSSPTKVNPIDLLYSASGAAEFRVTEGSDCSGIRVPIGAGSFPHLLSSSEGTKEIRVQFFDAVGNASACLLQSVYFDPNPPVVGIMQINYGQAATSSNIVTLSFPGVLGATRVMASEDPAFTGVIWDGFAPTKTFTLSPGNGVKTVYAKVADDAGHALALPSQTITLDTSPPANPSIYAAYDVTTQTSVLVVLSAGLVQDMWLTQDDPGFSTGGWEPYVGSKAFALTGTDGTKTLYAKFKKSTGVETAVVSDTVILDRTAPILPSVRINNGAAVLTSAIVTLNLSAVDSASGLAAYKADTADDFSVVSPQPYQPTDVYSFAAGDGLKTVWVIFYDKAGNYSAAASASALLDTSNPIVSTAGLELADGTPVNNGAVVRETRLRLVSSVSDLTILEMQTTTNGSFTGVAWEPYATSKIIDLPASGTATITARVRDQAGHVVTLLAGINVSIDMAAPSGTVSLTSPAVTSSTTVGLLLTANESSLAQVSEDPAFGGAAWFSAASTALTLNAGDGLRTIYARWRDGAGNVSAPKTTQVTLDQTPPQLAGFSIAQGALTNQQTVSLVLSAFGAEWMRVAESASCGGAWEAFATAKGWTFATSVNELKTVSVQYRDSAGNLSECLTRTIALDTQGPTYTAAKGIVINLDAAYATSRTVTLALNVTGATEVMLSESAVFYGAVWQPAVTATTWALSAGESAKSVYLKARDGAGNESAAQSDAIVVDTIAPAFNTASGPAVSPVEGITLALSASGASQMRLSEQPGFGDTSYTAFVAAAPFTLGATEGTHTIYIQLADEAGNESIVRSVNVVLDGSAPNAPVVSVLGGGYTTGSSISLQVLADGAAEMLVSQYAPMTDATWQPFSQLKAFTLAGAQGAKTIYVKVRDGALNESAPSAAAVILDSAAPSVTTFQAEDAGGAVITQSSSTRYYLRLAVTDATPVTVQFSTSSSWAGIPLESLQPLRPWDAAPPVLAAGETRNVYVRAVDAAGNATVAGPVSVFVDTLGPTSPSLGISPSLVSSPTVTLALSAVNADYIELSEDISFLAPAVIAYATAEPYTFLDTADGVKTLYARYADALGNYSGIAVASVTLDQTAPKYASFSIAQASPTKSATINLALAATGADFMAIAENDCAPSWEAYQTAKAYAFATTVNGTKTVAVRYKDAAGNATGCLTQTIDFDDQPPTLLTDPFRINYGAAATTNASVLLVSNVAGAAEIRVGEDSGLAGAGWAPYSATRTFGLSAGNGTKYVYAQYRDAAGNLSAIINDSILLDTTQVGVPYVSIQSDVTSSTTVTVNLGASNIDEMILSDRSDFATGTGWVAYTGVTAYTFAGADGTKTLYAKFRKTSGAETAVASDSYVLDRAAPSFSQLVINGGAGYTTSNQLTLTLTGVDEASGVQLMEVWETGDVSAAQAYVPALVFPVGAAQGVKTVWVRFADRAMNFAAPVSATIVFDSLAPGVSSFTVEDAAGDPLTVSNAARVVVHIAATDANPLQMLVSNRSDFAGSAWQPYQEFLQWDLPLPSLAGGEPRTVYARVRDAAGATVNAGSYGFVLDTIAPSNVSVDIAGTAATSPTVTVNFTYSNADFIEISQEPGFQAKKTFAAVAATAYTFASGDGVKTLYARFRDDAGNYSATVVDQITLDTTPPQLASFTIDEGTLTNASLIHLSLSAIDAAEMQISEGSCSGAWAPFATAQAYAFATLTEEAKTVAVRFRDAAGNSSLCLTRGVTFDKTAPAPVSILLAGGADVTRFSVVQLAAAAFDQVGVTEMQIANTDTFGGAVWQPVTTSTSWLLSPGEGMKTVYVRFRDGAGNVGGSLNDTILFDQTPPSQPSVVLAGGDLTNLANQRELVWDAVNVPGVSGYRVFECEGYQRCDRILSSSDTAGTRWPVPPAVNDYARSLYVEAVYADGTTSAPSRPAVLQWPAATSASATVLVVDDDGETMLNDGLIADLETLGYTVDVLEVPAGLSGPSAAVLETYPVVIWAADESPAPLTFEDQDTLDALTADQTVILWTPEFEGQVDGHPAHDRLMRGTLNEWVPVDGFTVIEGVQSHPAGNGLRFAPAFPAGVTAVRSINPDADSLPLLKIFGPHLAATAHWLPEVNRRAYFAIPYSYLAAARQAFMFTPYDWSSTPTPTGLTAYHGAVTLPLPFAFPFYGQYYNSITVTTHGFMTFQASGHAVTSAAAAASPLPPNAVIAALWGNLDPSQGGTITYGSTPGAFTVSYAGVPEFTSGVTQSVQVRLTPDGFMRYSFMNIEPAETAVVGIENPAGSQALLLDATGQSIAGFSFNFQSGGPSLERLRLLTRMMGYAFAPVRARIETTPSVTLSLTAGGAIEMQLSTDGVFDAEPWQPYASSFTLPIAPADGTQTIWVKYRDAAGNESVVASDTTVIDTTPPLAATPVIGNGAYSNNQIVTVQTAAVGAVSMVLSEDVNFAGAVVQPWAPSATYVLSAVEGPHHLYIRYIDAAGNSTVKTADTVLDLTPPEAPVIVTPSQITTSTVITVELLNDNPQANEAVAFASYEVQGGNYAGWTAVVPTISGGRPAFVFTLGDDGEYRLSVRAKDMAGNISPADTVTITLDNQVPEPPTNLIIREGNGIINLAWTASASNDVLSYRVYYGAAPGSLTGAFAAEGPSPISLTRTATRLNGLSNNATVFLGIAAVDKAGHESAYLTGEALPNEATPEEARAFDVADHRSLSVDNGLAVSLRAASFEVWDMSHPAAPVTVATVTPAIAGLNFTRGVLDWPQFYAIDQGNNQVVYWDLSTPSAPQMGTGYVFPNGEVPYGLSVTQGRVTVGGTYQISAYRRNTTGTLTLLNTYSGFGAETLQCVPRICYGGNGGYLLAFDTSNLNVPSLNPLGDLSLGGLIRDFKVYNGKAYIAAQQGSSSFMIADVSNPAAMQIIGRAFSNEYATSVVVEGPYAYVGYMFGLGVRVIDLSDPARPVLAGKYTWPDSYPNSLALIGQHLVVGDNFSARFVELADPQVFFTQSTYSFGYFAGAGFLSLDGTMLASGLFGYRIMDLSDAADPQVISGDNTNGLGLFLKNHILYSTMDAMLRSQAVTGPVPRIIHEIPLASQTNEIEVHGQLAYLAEWDNGLRIANVANPGAMSWISSCYPIAIGTCLPASNTMVENYLTVNNRTAFFADNYYAESTLWAVDIRDPAAPYPAAATFVAKNTSGLCSQGNRIAWGTMDNGFVLLEYDPINAVYTQTGLVSGWNPRECAFAGDYLYTTWYDQLEIYDISDPAYPRVVATHPAGSIVVVTGNMAYLGDSVEGLITGKVEP